MIFDLIYLAQAAQPAANDPQVSVAAVTGLIVGVIGAIAAAFARQNGKAAGAAEATINIAGQPLKVAFAEEFVTRREFERLEATMAVNATKMEALFEKTMQSVAAQNASLSRSIDNQNVRLTKKIEEVASGAYQGRQKIWTKVNEDGERVARLEATSDVANQIGKLAEVLQPPVIKS